MRPLEPKGVAMSYPRVAVLLAVLVPVVALGVQKGKAPAKPAAATGKI